MIRPLLPCVLIASACARAPQPAPLPRPTPVEALRSAIDSMVGDPKFRNAHWGLLIVDPTSGDTLYSRNAGKLFMPASNQKLVTGAVSLAVLGPDFRFRTDFVARGPIRDGVLDGDLAVVGRGDPTISDHALGDARRGLLAIADSLAARGIRRIEGGLVSGADVFPDAPLGAGWAWDDLDYPYSAGVDELLVNEGFATITVRAGSRAGDVPTFVVSPARAYPAVSMLARSMVNVAPNSGPRLTVESDPSGAVVRITGDIAVNDSAKLEVAFRNQGAAYLAALREALTARGIDVKGRTRPDAASDTLFSTWSPTLADIMPLMQKPSQNQIAEVLFKSVALARTGVGSADSGRRVVERELQSWGADSAGAAVRDGSGLSRHDYLSPETIIRVLDAMRRAPTFDVFYRSLPVAGVDGTIRSRMKGTPAEHNVHAKTGFIDKARSLSGYVTAADGRLLYFSALCNNWTVSVREVERVQDQVAIRLATLQLPASRTPLVTAPR